MHIARTNRIDIAYESHGTLSGPPVLLIMGLGGQLTMWPAAFIASLAGAGYHVITFDNRDIGLSSKFDGVKAPNLIAQIALSRLGVRLKVPYTLDDMANDAVSLLDTLEVERAHIVGVSMGGMIGQFVSTNAPNRVSSLTAIMTTTGNPKLPRPGRDVFKAMVRRGSPPTTRQARIDAAVAAFSVIGTPGEDQSTNGMRDRVTASVDRDYSPQGVVRQTAAIIASGDFREVTRQIKTPTLVIHGSADPLVSSEGGRDIARLVSGARLEILDGMGHDLPPSYLPRITQLVLDHLGQA